MMAERRMASYSTVDGQQLLMQFPDGLVSPPTISLHQPLVGTVEFIYQGSQEVASD